MADGEPARTVASERLTRTLLLFTLQASVGLALLAAVALSDASALAEPRPS